MYDKLLAYSALSASFVSIHQSANAQLLYRDITPDASIVAGENDVIAYSLDFDGDGTMDLQIRAFSFTGGTFWDPSDSSQNVQVRPQAGAEILKCWNAYLYSNTCSSLADFPNGFFQVRAVDSGSMLTSSQLFTGANIHFHHTSSWGPTNPDWDSTKFIGVRIPKDSDYYYGWVRCQNPLGITRKGVTIFDFALSEIPNTPVMVGDISGPLTNHAAARNVLGQNFDFPASSGNLKISFEIPPDETSVLEYRAYVLPASFDNVVSLDSLSSLPATAYQSILPNGNDVSTFFPLTKTTATGESIIPSKWYRIRVVTMMDDGMGGSIARFLSLGSESFWLNPYSSPSGPISSPGPDSDTMME